MWRVPVGFNLSHGGYPCVAVERYWYPDLNLYQEVTSLLIDDDVHPIVHVHVYPGKPRPTVSQLAQEFSRMRERDGTAVDGETDGKP